ncbi:unnamed protein product [Mycena citricolor]|uniref:Uncharacterized protein n=1 Tax=Mycena citricolor TaxID=2018698 RepID=A0AAD2Q6Z1_9AGAR|nr:unnamed protein product [Mycena citricolor]
MKLSFTTLLAFILALQVIAAPVPQELDQPFEAGLQDLNIRAKPKSIPKSKPVSTIPISKPAVKKPVAKPAVKEPVTKPVKPAAKPVSKPVAAKPISKPAAKPISKPAKKPVAKPVAKPASKPAAKPVAKPASKPKAKPVAKPASKKPATAKPNTKKPVLSPSKSKNSTVPACSARQIAARDYLSSEERELAGIFARNPLEHPDGHSRVRLFHGTDKGSSQSVKTKPLLSKIEAQIGDFNHGSSAFYLTDSLLGAAQFACLIQANTLSSAAAIAASSVDVVEFEWNPPTNTRIHNFASRDQAWLSFVTHNGAGPENVSKEEGAAADEILSNSDMIVGPVANNGQPKPFTDSFFQYAMLQQKTIDDGLVGPNTIIHSNILCKNVPKGVALSDSLYAEGQGANPNFNQRVKQLQDAQLTAGAPICSQ